MAHSPGMEPAHCPTHPHALAEAACERCGDFVCSLCADLSDAPRCARCAVRGTVAWEARGEESWFAAFWLTWAEAMTSPTRLGQKLSGTGYVLVALTYVLSAGLVGGLPLALALAWLSARGADPFTLGLGSTSALSTSAAWVFGALSATTALGVFVVSWSGTAFGMSRLLGAIVPFGLILRAFAYGLSLLAIPFLGPVLFAPALLLGCLALHGCLVRRIGTAQARWVSALSLSLWSGAASLLAWAA